MTVKSTNLVANEQNKEGYFRTRHISYRSNFLHKLWLSVAWDLGEFINKERKKKEKQTTVSQTQCLGCRGNIICIA